MNWLDVTVVGAVAGGLLLGAQRGILRQGALMAGFYVSLVLAARYNGEAASLLVAHLPRADVSLASVYTLAGLTVGGTLVLGYLSQVAYSNWTLPSAPMLDRLAGAGLGVAWSWAVLAFSVTVLLYGLSVGWGAQEPLRQRLAMQMQTSQLTGVVRATLPPLRETILPWLPGGLPAPLSA
jgi:uncharacterized membrane protein required for colicin V production